MADPGIDQGGAEFLLPLPSFLLPHFSSSKMEKGLKGGSIVCRGSRGAGAPLDPPLAPPLIEA